MGPSGSLYVSDQGNGTAAHPDQIAVYASASTAGNLTAAASVLSPPVGTSLGVAVDPSGRVFVSDYEAYRVLISPPAAAQTPADPKATAATKSLLSELVGREGQPNQVIIGQEIPTYDAGPASDNPGWYSPFSDLAADDLPTPAMMEGEVSYLSRDQDNEQNTPAIDQMIDHAKAGGIAALDWHPNNPIAGGSYNTPDPTAQLESIVKAGTKANTNWDDQLDQVAGIISQFSAAGVPVLFRPLVEMNGNFFWWGDTGASGSARSAHLAAFVALWRQMFNYLTVTEGLHNILFVYSVQPVTYSAVAPVLDYFPGGSDVDVTGVDDYNNDLYLEGSSPGVDSYDDMVALGKPWGLTEAGQSVGAKGTGTGATTGHNWDAETVLARLAQFPAMAFANFWYSSYNDEGAETYVLQLSDVADTAGLLASAQVDVLPTGTP
jgi:beta-mannanase